MKIEILYQDQDIVVINKPAGLIVNNADSVVGETVQSWFGANFLANPDFTNDHWRSLVPADFDATFGQPEDVFELRQGLVHRLDKQTSGVLLLALNPGALVNLLYQFKHHLTEKKYLCLAHGKFSVPKDRIILPMGRSKQDPTKFAIREEGRLATTDYQVRDFYPSLNLEKISAIFDQDGALSFAEFKKRTKNYQGFSLLECWPKTGRTHQIRVHLSAIKHPLVGDRTYVGKKRAKLDPIWCHRHFLHAEQLKFTHPRTKKPMEIKAGLSPDLTQVLTYLRRE